MITVIIILFNLFFFFCYADFDAACNLFKEVQKRDPYSLEHVDTYSNILYVKVRSSWSALDQSFSNYMCSKCRARKKSRPFVWDK